MNCCRISERSTVSSPFLSVAPGVAFQIVRTWQAKKCTTQDYTCTSILICLRAQKKNWNWQFSIILSIQQGKNRKSLVVKMDIFLTLQEVWGSGEPPELGRVKPCKYFDKLHLIGTQGLYTSQVCRISSINMFLIFAMPCC